MKNSRLPSTIKQSKQKKKETFNLAYTYTDHFVSYSREPIEDDEWDNGDSEYEWTLNSVRLFEDYLSFVKKQNTYYYSVLQVPFQPKLGQEVYVVCVRYDTGSTFGRVNGKGTVVGIYETLAEANKIKEQIDKDEFEGYCEWKGYFENFQGCDIETMIIRA